MEKRFGVTVAFKLFDSLSSLSSGREMQDRCPCLDYDNGIIEPNGFVVGGMVESDVLLSPTTPKSIAQSKDL